MQGYQIEHFDGVSFSVAMTDTMNQILVAHLDKGPEQEDLTFAYWRPSRGLTRYSAIVVEAVLPSDDERVLDGNVAFTNGYLQRVLNELPAGAGIALLHSHLGPGWQGMSDDDVVAERDRMGGAVAARSELPVLGLTWGTDGTWSARFWLRAGRNAYERRWAATVRVVGARVMVSHHPRLSPEPGLNPSQAATISVWGQPAHADIVRAHVGVIGLGSVGSIVAEALSRTGVQQLTLVDHDVVEERNLDRTLGATAADVQAATPKVIVAQRTCVNSHTAANFLARPLSRSLLTTTGLAGALDCDVLFSCVDRPLPRHLMNLVAKAHLIPVIDGGILARIDDRGRPVHVDWRVHTVGPGRQCLYCLGALRRSDVSLDREGLLDSPDYIQNLPAAEREIVSRRNVFAFSLSVAAHEVLQFVGLVTGMQRIGGIGPQHYAAYPGRLTVAETTVCARDCDIDALTATALDLTANVLCDADLPPGAPTSLESGLRASLRHCARRMTTLARRVRAGH